MAMHGADAGGLPPRMMADDFLAVATAARIAGTSDGGVTGHWSPAWASTRVGTWTCERPAWKIVPPPRRARPLSRVIEDVSTRPEMPGTCAATLVAEMVPREV